MQRSEVLRSEPVGPDEEEMQDMPSLDIAGIALRLGCSKAHANNLVEVGEIAAIDVGAPGGRRMWRTTPRELQQFIDDRRAEQA